MPHLPTYKRFPGSTGVEVPATVTVSTPIPARKVPLKGMKSLRCPKVPISEIFPSLPHFPLSSEDAVSIPWWNRIPWKSIAFWLVALPGGLCLYLFGLLAITWLLSKLG